MNYSEIPERKNPGDVLVTKKSGVEAQIETVFEVIEDLKLIVELEENVKNEAERRTGK